MTQQLPDWLRRRAIVSPAHPAVECGDDRWSFSELDRRADASAAVLRGLGVQPGDRVAMLAGNSAAFAQAVFGIARAGAVLVPLNLRLTRPEIEWQVRDCEPAVLITDRAEWLDEGEARPHPASLRSSARSSPLPEGEGMPVSTTSGLQAGSVPEPTLRNRRGSAEGGGEVRAEARPHPDPLPLRYPASGPEGEGTLRHSPRAVALSEVAVGPAPGAGSRREEREYDADAVQAIIYTSGTSGRPKGAMLTFGNFFWSAFGSMAQLGVHGDDRWLVALPLFHVGGLSILFRSVVNGTTAVIHEAFDPARANRAIDEEGVTLVSLVSTMLLRMLEARQDRPFPASLRCVLLGGGPVPGELINKGLELGIPIAQTYGLTETASQATTLLLAEIVERAGSAGKPLLPTEVRIEREDGSICEPGEPGELVVRGATVSIGYWRRPEDTERALRGGWLHSGDAGYMDGDGYLYVIDRRDDLIVSGGENVYPAEVESVLSTHPAVREAGVFALPDAAWGQSVAAAVCLRDGVLLTQEALQAFCRERLAGYKAPRRVFFTGELPRTASGKLLRRELRDRFAAGESA